MSSLYIDRKGVELKLSGEVLICYENEERIGTIPLVSVDRIYLKGDVKLQASLLAKLGKRGIGIIFLSGRKNIPSLFLAQPHNDAHRRVMQYELSHNEPFCLAFSKKIIQLKLETQKNWLSQALNVREDKQSLLESKVKELNELITKINQQTNLASLRGVEGRAASVYFMALSQYLPKSLDFNGRNRRPPRDPFNAVLSLSYTLLHSEAVLASYGAGLDPYIGFYHSLDFSRESFACDLVEPIRPLVDNWLIGLFRSKELRIEYFSTTQSGCMLGKTGRINFYKAYEEQAEQWRKILTENCHDIIQVLKEVELPNLPQRKESIEPSSPQQLTELQWQELLEHYYFNQHTMMQNIEFSF
ncbi:CRISPR-associated endonuclease Cas1 [Phocoenobacter atlanticus]|uniref:CRISPR-associated endonuclease Cas1 n=1 Tax=Phocoenobacter atlanticus TaxID=3416742 RepID=UPI0027484BA3|nr:CRISPR-associated endonuclease Cas1 [Pasteurella atlantica]MDP8101629.1 CRISPR-associated endonuclease Cas1 [Pasteurella atlantica]